MSNKNIVRYSTVPCWDLVSAMVDDIEDVNAMSLSNYLYLDMEDAAENWDYDHAEWLEGQCDDDSFYDDMTDECTDRECRYADQCGFDEKQCVLPENEGTYTTPLLCIERVCLTRNNCRCNPNTCAR